jgi:outer membrane receptor protein involved in Fe transport
LEVPYGKLALRYGLEGFRDQTDTVSTGSAGASADGSVWFSGTNPVGERTLASGFSEATFTHDTWLEISAGGRYDHYDLSGLSSVRYCRKPVIIRGRLTCANVDWVYRETDVEQSDGRFSPTATLAITPVTGLQLFGKYSEGYRPGTLAETVLGGAHIGNLFYYAPNPDLKPEQSQTWEAGANLLYNDVLKDGDKFRMKAVYFDRTMRDFIALGQVSGDPFGTGLQTSFFQYVNLLGDTEMKGVEIEANYEARDFYIGASFTYNNALYAQDYNVNPWGNATGNPTGLIYYLFVAPEYKFTVDAGIRMLDEHLTLGVRVTHIVPSEQIGLNSITYAPSEYTTLDLYGSCKSNSERFAFAAAPA